MIMYQYMTIRAELVFNIMKKDAIHAIEINTFWCHILKCFYLCFLQTDM